MVNSLDFLDEKIGNRQRMSKADLIGLVLFKKIRRFKKAFISFLSKHKFFSFYLLALLIYLFIKFVFRYIV
ncbi:hypothetical protein CVU82_00845 [Candidatus Falkowbacteria bacterium HGW-Falkowbacteria-1]|uniref:Uncharacterized protein n=1 Tax=Candidatus Falkowbacteria bacterium HGW-Falkowbacteria-1 TaxID=2013768 RepID=A0A2N2EAM5_9BACT|nr:MAG: hypothetical protein CVU82_00845 [Candidatus Falkowbacteria bacterium HGW-Falkowbacteria-1]